MGKKKLDRDSMEWLERNRRYRERVLRDAEERLARGETKYPSGENIGFIASIFRWLFAKSSDELEDRRKE